MQFYTRVPSLHCDSLDADSRVMQPVENSLCCGNLFSNYFSQYNIELYGQMFCCLFNKIRDNRTKNIYTKHVNIASCVERLVVKCATCTVGLFI